MNALNAALKTAWKYLAWTAAGAVVVAAFDPEFLKQIDVPMAFVPILALAGKSLATFVAIKIKENKP